MSESEKRITRVTFDMDGTAVPGPAPLSTLMRLARRRFNVKQEQPVLGYYPHPTTPLERMWAEWDYYSHSKREVKPEAVDAIKKLALLKEERVPDLEIGILTGRDSDRKHALSKKVLQKAGVLPHVSGLLLFNPGYRSALWKEMKAIEGGVHFEDDLEPTLRMAAKGTVVYMLRNLSNRDCLLRRNGIVLPYNVMRVQDITEGMVDLTQRLRRAA